MITRMLRAIAAGVVAAAPASAGAQTVQARLTAVVDQYAGRGVSGSVLVARGGTVLLRVGRGLADRGAGVPNTPETEFNIGSLTKQVTAAAVLLLAQRGKLRTSDPVSAYVADAPVSWRAITIRHLLTHTSGIPDYVNTDSFDTIKRAYWTPTALIGVFRDNPLDFTPGTREEYSNSNYVLLGHIIERVSGESYASFLSANIFQPLGMIHSGVVPGGHSTRAARGYATTASGVAPADSIDMSSTFAAGNIFSTVDDLLRWQAGLFGGRLLPAPALEEMTTPFIGDYAYGVHSRMEHGRRVIFHAGRVDGFSAQLAYYPAEKVVIIALSNIWNREMAGLAADLADAVFK